MLTTILLFRFKGHETATRRELALVWVPLVALDWAIIAFVVDLLLWYGEKNDAWRTAIIGASFIRCRLDAVYDWPQGRLG